MAHYEMETKKGENYGKGLSRELDEFLRGFRPDKRTKEGKALLECMELARMLRERIDEYDGFKGCL